MGQASRGERFLDRVARRRTLLLVVLPIAGALAADPQPLPYLAGVLAAAVGQAVRFWAAGHIVKATELTTTGPYAHVRNPLYLGSLLITLGWGAMSGRLVVAAALLAVFALTHALAICSEERYLEERFGEEFAAYRRQVPRLLPRLLPRPGSPPAPPNVGGPGRTGPPNVRGLGGRAGNYSWRRALECDGEGWSALAVAALAVVYATRFGW